MHKWSHLIVNICAKYFFFFSCHQVGKLTPLSPQLFQPAVQAVRDQSLPWGRCSVWQNKLCCRFWIQNFERIPHMGMSLDSGVGRRLRVCVCQKMKFPRGRGLGTEDGKHGGCCPHLLEKGHNWSCRWAGLGAQVEGLSRNSLSSMPNDAQRWC